MAAIGNFSFLGNSTVASAVEAEALNSLLIVLLSIIIAKAVIVVIQKYLKGVAKRTKTDIDDFMLDVITKPLYLGIIAAGIYLGLKPLSARLAYGLWLDRAFMVAYIFIAAFLVSRILGFAITRSLHVQKKYEKTPKLINKLIYVAVYLVAALVIIGSFNVEVTPILATLGLGSLAIGLALKDTLGNFFAGMHIISDKPISVGDYIEVEG
ncbi:MAG: mechanosensitive ion channel, partial [Candidatus Aenigmarchaeota archaeon]|nr:mechanosensitive ion channel [Candidatus Aenigmarchaeota archaeon]